MLGAIIGNIVGSIYGDEGKRIKTKDFVFFDDSCHFKIDSICTAAVADILLNDRQPATTVQEWCRCYPGFGGKRFREFVNSDTPKPYNSYGNGAAMRVSPAAFLNRDNLYNARCACDKVTEITHNHPEGMKGARATTHAIWLAFQGEGPENIRQMIATEYDYDLSKTVNEIRLDYSFDMTCQGTVPQAITCALESVSFEDAIRNAVSLGGDADTLAAIAGPIAEVLHGIPATIKQRAESRYLANAPDILEVMREMYQVFDQKDSVTISHRVDALVKLSTPEESKADLPDYKSIMLPLLKHIDDRREYHRLKIADALGKEVFELTSAQWNMIRPDGLPIFNNRCDWARYYLKEASLIDSPRRGYSRITDRGLALLKKWNNDPEEIKDAISKSPAAFLDYIDKRF